MSWSFALPKAIGFGNKALSYAKQFSIAFGFGRRRHRRLWRWPANSLQRPCTRFHSSDPFRRNNSSGRRHQCRTVDINECAAGVQGTLAANARKTRQVAVPVFRHRIAETNNDHASTFQELIADFVRAESFAEVTGDTNHITECELAIRLPADRAESWRTNLLAVLESWTGCRGNGCPPEESVGN